MSTIIVKDVQKKTRKQRRKKNVKKANSDFVYKAPVTLVKNRRGKRGNRANGPMFKGSAAVADRAVANFNSRHDSYVNNIGGPERQMSDKAMFSQYIRCLLQNWITEARYPDSLPRQTALFSSVSSFTVPMHEENGEYRFSMAVQPQMGDLTDPSHFQAAVASIPSTSTATYADADWSDPANYLTAYNGRDPRIDINTNFFTNSVTSGYHGRTALGAAQAVLAQAPLTGTTGQNFQGPHLTGNTQTYTTTASVGSLNVIQNLDGSFTLPAGSYSMTLGSTATAGAAALVGVRPYVTTRVPNTGYTIIDDIQYSNPIAAGATVTSSHVYSFIIAQPTKFYTGLVKTVAGTNTSIAANDLTALVNDVNIAPTIFTTPGPNNGAISLIRPVSQTILVTYMGPTLTDGGRISGCYLPRNTLVQNYFSPSTNQLGNLQLVENLANLSGAFDGPLRDGTFGWWCPYDQVDTEFRTIADMNAQQWPAMVVSGSFNPVGSGVTGNVADIVRVRLVTCYEYITKSTAYEQRICSGSYDIIDRVNRALAQSPHFMANKSHLDWIRQILGGIMKYGPIALKGASLAASLL